MLYRVVCLLLAFAGSAAAAPVVSHPAAGERAAALAEDLPLAELLYGFRYTAADDEPHPMNAARGNLVWDASGTGCIDGGGWEDPLPGVKGEFRTPVFCIPQPCVGLLTHEDLARDVYGRPLEEGEYATYLDRLGETCGALPAPAVDRAGTDLDEFLRFASLQLVSAPFIDDFSVMTEDERAPAALAARDASFGGALTPVNWRTGPAGSNLMATAIRTYSPGIRFAGHGVRGVGVNGDSTPHRTRSDGGPSPHVVAKPKPPRPGRPPRRGGKRPDKPLISVLPDLPMTGGDGPGDGGETDQPAPVPLAGGLPLMLTALGALLAGRGLPGQRRRSRRELIG